MDSDFWTSTGEFIIDQIVKLGEALSALDPDKPSLFEIRYRWIVSQITERMKELGLAVDG